MSKYYDEINAKIDEARREVYALIPKAFSHDLNVDHKAYQAALEKARNRADALCNCRMHMAMERAGEIVEIKIARFIKRVCQQLINRCKLVLGLFR